jgi:hypothetical protein
MLNGIVGYVEYFSVRLWHFVYDVYHGEVMLVKGMSLIY